MDIFISITEILFALLQPANNLLQVEFRNDLARC